MWFGRTLSLPILPGEDALEPLEQEGPLPPRKSLGSAQHSLGVEHWKCLADYSESLRNRLTPAASAAVPDHLLMLVSGIYSTTKDWLYVEKQFRARLGNRVLVHPSSCNPLTKTFQGIDVAGKRLAEEVRSLAKEHPSLTKVSFVGHSLGGLLCRYCIGMLYEPPEGGSPSENVPWPNRGRLAGLLPVDFITLATPHLGSRGKKQLPILAGVQPLEKLTARMASLAIGRTGAQLFLTDSTESEPPLLLRMSRDCEEGLFISALRSFQLRVAYANAGFDHTVGWRTSCIRRENDLPVLPKSSIAPRYKYVVGVEECQAVELGSRGVIERALSGSSMVEMEATVWSHIWDGARTPCDRLEEEMVAGLEQVSWRKVDVCFRGAYMAYFAHHTIQVQHARIHKEGAGVIAHLADTLLRQEQHFNSPKVEKDAEQGTTTPVEGKPVSGNVLATLKKKTSGVWGFDKPPKSKKGSQTDSSVKEGKEVTNEGKEISSKLESVKSGESKNGRSPLLKGWLGLVA